jgi:hypothetical protein
LRQKCNLNNIFHEGKGYFATGKIKGTFENLGGALVPLITPPPRFLRQSQQWVFYMFCMLLLQTFLKNFEFKRLIPLEKINIADISIILKRSQKLCYRQN